MSSPSKRSIFRNEMGFSLIDVVVTVAIIVALSVGGFVAYTGLIDNAKQAAVGAAADQVYTAVVVAEGSGLTTPAKIKEDYENSTSEITVDISGSGDSLRVIAANVSSPKIRAVRGFDAGTPLPPVLGAITVASTNLAPDPRGLNTSTTRWGRTGGSGTNSLVDDMPGDIPTALRFTRQATAATAFGPIIGTAMPANGAPIHVKMRVRSSVPLIVGLDARYDANNANRTTLASGIQIGPEPIDIEVSGVSFPSATSSAASRVVLTFPALASAIGDTIDITMVMVSADPSYYFDGTMADQVIDGVTYSYGWTGAANGSPSQATYRPELAD